MNITRELGNLNMARPKEELYIDTIFKDEVYYFSN
jgi:hypothetical protein